MYGKKPMMKTGGMNNPNAAANVSPMMKKGGAKMTKKKMGKKK